MFAVPSWCEAGKNGSPTLLVDNQHSQKGNGSCRESSNASERERESVCVCVWYKKILTAALFFIYMGKQWQKVFAKIIVYLLAESHPGSDDRVGRDRGQRQIVRDRVQIA